MFFILFCIFYSKLCMWICSKEFSSRIYTPAARALDRRRDDIHTTQKPQNCQAESGNGHRHALGNKKSHILVMQEYASGPTRQMTEFSYLSAFARPVPW